MDEKKADRRLSTKAIHAGFRFRESYGSAAEPMYPATTYVFPSAEAAAAAFKNPYAEESDFVYSRMSHPNAAMVEERLTAIEPGSGAAAIFASGESAIFGTIWGLLPNGGVIACLNPIYGGTHHMMARFFGHMSDFAINEYDARDGVPDFGFGPDVLFLETPTNPTLVMVDIDAVAAAVKQSNPNCIVVVDNTFMGALQTPFEISEHVDLIVYSGTKYMGGHSNVLCGAVLARKGREYLILDIERVRGDFGGILHPFECWLLLTFLKTYAIRMNTQSERAQIVAEFLQQHHLVERVDFPGLWQSGDVYYEIFKKQCTAPGAMIAFYLKGFDRERIFRFQNILAERHHILLAVSLGGVKSLLCHPASTTHACMGEEEQLKYGITENLIRLSVGAEEAEVLIEDLQFALENC
ncbi:PLP-dependent transferase [Candidatus Falkowbacteria bacterium]|jgi:methionine-gamma-lyase|nr:PLP-dependent transferase [Candidatus Falkowbacteria bacterium]MBT5502586.1 PLP-dependent transferase [Candidatus Falkowbacteria bacterium]MBT6574605.1 PLP-dependent transferase [Candidatus Falkowbacteria bacterium]MBT7349016.1 PLP-dependent transferase [Candidatus Falkowbacteria bacterium]MBT7500358.1 PLP-dependent transferase [Candidatus Falkowbacteria bacterium]